MDEDAFLDPVTRLICENAVLDYDPVACVAVAHFRQISRRAHCMFAAKASTWGSRDWDESMSLEDNVGRSMLALRRFLIATARGQVDIFVLEIVGIEYFSSLAEFGLTVWRVLRVISEDDPKGVHALESFRDGQADKSWLMSFGGVTMFVLTFCPLYPATHSRHMFGTNPSSCFLLLQSGAAFDGVGDFNLSPRELQTLPSLCGLSDRDRIRASFLRAGCPFNIDHAHCVVRPLDDFADEEPHWWEESKNVTNAAPPPMLSEMAIAADGSFDELVAAELERERKPSLSRYSCPIRVREQ